MSIFLGNWATLTALTWICSFANQTPSGVHQYQGRFLGALLKEKSKVFGGTLTTPGITIPAGKEIIANPESITKAKDLLS